APHTDADTDDGEVRTVVLELSAPEDPAPVRSGIGIVLGSGDESYLLRVDAAGIHCRARTPEGVFRAASAAVQMIADGSELQHQEIHDAPAYAWRGLMVDPARHFLTPEDLRRIIDLAALYKLNVLHLHLTDNEGWRLEVPGLPELTAGGGPFYTTEEYRALQDYAAARYVTVIPEIDLPGHCGALRAAFPDLPPAPIPDKTARTLEALGMAQHFTAPLDLADSRTADLVSRIFAHVCAATDAPFVHIGADEAAGMTHDSYAGAVRFLRETVRAAGKEPIGWQEHSRAGIAPGDLAQFWVDPSMTGPATLEASGVPADFAAAVSAFFAPTADDLARIVAGRGKVLLSPQSHLYLDRPHDAALVAPHQAEAAARLGMPVYEPRGIRQLAAWDPTGHQVPTEQIAGIEAAVWAESITCFDDLTLLLLPRLPAVAEVAWSGTPSDWDEYRERLGRHARLWTQRGLTYAASTEVDWEPTEPTT
ncbi:family 20 glycosylhydrolase, partial [Streptodolium elevatio]